jgi:hypothetical protein
VRRLRHIQPWSVDLHGESAFPEGGDPLDGIEREHALTGDFLVIANAPKTERPTRDAATPTPELITQLLDQGAPIGDEIAPGKYIVLECGRETDHGEGIWSPSDTVLWAEGGQVTYHCSHAYGCSLGD